MREHPFWNRKPSYLCNLRFNWHVQPLSGNGQISTAELYTDWFKYVSYKMRWPRLIICRFWADFDPTRQMVDIQLGGIIPRTPAEPILLEKATKSRKFLDRAERSASKPSRGHDAEALQGWEHQPICVIDPFVRVRVSTYRHAVFFYILMDPHRTLRKTSLSRYSRTSRRSAGRVGGNPWEK